MAEQTLRQGKPKHSKKLSSYYIAQYCLSHIGLRFNSSGDVRWQDVPVNFNDNVQMIQIFLGI